MALTAKEYASETQPTWCPGCGDFAVLKAVQGALARLQLDPDNVAIVSGIGCSSNFPHFLRAYGVHSIHGRLLPVAQGIKLANPGITVIGAGGDGDGYGIGAGHFVHCARRNIDMTYIVMDNEIYGLTTGQASPTSMEGHVTKSTPTGVTERPLNPVALSLAAGSTFVARGFSGDPKNLEDLVEQAIQHKGFAHVDVFSPCVTFNKLNTYQWFKQRVYDLQKEGHDATQYGAALQRATEWGERIPYGLFYQAEVPTYESKEPALKALGKVTEAKAIADVNKLLEAAQ